MLLCSLVVCARATLTGGEMFDLFDRKKKMAMVKDLMEAAREAEQKRTARARYMSFAEDHGISVPEGKNGEHADEHLATQLAAFLTKSAIKRNGWALRDLSDGQEFASWLVLFVASDYLSRRLGAKFEWVTAGAGLIVFGGTPEDFAATFDELGSEWNRMITDPSDNQIVQSLGNHIAAWVNNRADTAAEKTSGMLKLMADAVV